jgi:hypothetical protein
MYMAEMTDAERQEALATFSRPLPEFPVEAKCTALLTIDMQYLDAHPDFGIGLKARQAGQRECPPITRLRGVRYPKSSPENDFLTEIAPQGDDGHLLRRTVQRLRGKHREGSKGPRLHAHRHICRVNKVSFNS